MRGEHPDGDSEGAVENAGVIRGDEARVSRIAVVALGDSFTAGNPGYDPDPARQPPDGNHPNVAGRRRLGELAFSLPPGQPA